MADQIRPGAVHFVDRLEQQERALRAAEEWDTPSRPLCLALTGRSGSGKTELAFRLARQLAGRHPDGVLYVDLEELRRDGVVESADALGDLLGGLGVAPDLLSPSLAARAKQYWTRTASARLVVVVDNARYGSEVVPLLPASGTSTVIVTSHGPLADLEYGAAVDLPLHPLTDQDALTLLQLIAEDPRLTAEPDAARGLVELCSGLPAALHVAGRRMRERRRRSLSRLLTEFSADLHRTGLPTVERVWDAAYRDLDPGAALLYRLLAVHPGATFTVEAAVALLGRGPDVAADALDDLERAGLLDSGPRWARDDDRMRLPPLLRAHAERCAQRDGAEEERDAAVRRLVRWYLRQAQRADALAAGRRMTFGPVVPPIPDAVDVTFAPIPDAGSDVRSASGAVPQSVAQRAARWLAAERHALHGCVSLAFGRELDAETWALCEPLWTRYLDHPHHTDDIEAFRLGVAAAQRAGDLPALIRMRCQLARPLWEQGEFAVAGQELDLALTACDTLGQSTEERKLLASTVEFHGMLRSARGDWTGAAEDFTRARAVHREIDNAYGALLQTYRLGQAVAALGELERAAELLTEAHRTAGELRRERMTARTGFALGGVLHRLGRWVEARGLFSAALASAQARGADRGVVEAHDALAALAGETGDTGAAAEHRAAAQAIRERNGLA